MAPITHNWRFLNNTYIEIESENIYYRKFRLDKYRIFLNEDLKKINSQLFEPIFSILNIKNNPETLAQEIAIILILKEIAHFLNKTKELTYGVEGLTFKESEKFLIIYAEN